MSAGEPFDDIVLGPPAVHGFLHRAATPTGDALVLTHGAGGNCRSPLLVALADAFADVGITTLRCDLPFRQSRRRGPPSPAGSALDRRGLEHAVLALRRLGHPRAFLGGLSYGGRQASMLAAEKPARADALLLLSYPLHPPGRPMALRTAHWPDLRTPTIFVHGSADPFGSLEELNAARALIPIPTDLLSFADAGHGLLPPRPSPAETHRIAHVIVEAFTDLRARRDGLRE